MSYLKVLSDGSSWPGIAETDELEWKLRYNPDNITKEDLLVIASILGSYSYLVYDADKAKWKLVSDELSKAYLRE